MNEGLEKAITIAGSQAKLAKRIKDETGKYVSHQAVQQWCAKGMVPVNRVIDVVRAVQFKVTREQLRPDFFGEIKQGANEGSPEHGTEASTPAKPRAGDVASDRPEDSAITETKSAA